MSLTLLLMWLDVATKVGLLAGGLFTGWHYLDTKQTARVERTIEYVGALSEGETAKAREAVSAELRGQLRELSRISGTPMAAADFNAIHATIVKGLMSQSRGRQGLGPELDRLLDFFERVEICVETSLCDRDTARAFLGDYGRTLWINFRPHIEELRPDISSYGSGLERFVAALPAEPAP